MTRRPPRRSLPSLLALLAGLALVLGACGQGDLPQNTLDPEGPIARQLDGLWDKTFAIAVVVFVLVNFLCVFVIVKYRAKSDDDAPKQVHGNARLEIAWTILPAFVLAVLGVLTLDVLFDINERASGDDVLDIEVIGHQWWFEYRYPDLDVVTANELFIPTDRTVQLAMTSVDVIHAYWPPKLAGKLDVVPGRTNYMQLKADEAGTYWGQCTEYCGLSHGYMRLRVVALEPQEWDEWVKGQQRPAPSPSDSLAKEGEAMITSKGCAGCHTVNGLQGAEGTKGPNLTHLFSRKTFAGSTFDLNERNLREWLRDPPAMKPMDPENGQGMPNLGLSEDDITKLIAYLETLE